MNFEPFLERDLAQRPTDSYGFRIIGSAPPGAVALSAGRRKGTKKTGGRKRGRPEQDYHSDGRTFAETAQEFGPVYTRFSSDRSSRSIFEKTGFQLSLADCLNSRTVGYQGLSSRSNIHTQ